MCLLFIDDIADIILFSLILMNSLKIKPVFLNYLWKCLLWTAM